MALAVLDPGHGGIKHVGGSSPNNATGPTGLLEKTLTLQVALLARTRLTALGHRVRLTRDSDVNLGLAARAALARTAKADAFVSIHFNGFRDTRVQGTETFVHEGATAGSLALAGTVQTALLAATGLRDRGVKRARFGVLNPRSHGPATSACLAEISFLSDPEEERRLRDAAYLARLADALAAGIVAFLAAAEPKRA